MIKYSGMRQTLETKFKLSYFYMFANNFANKKT